MIADAVFVILPLCLAMAAFSDLFTMTIPNRISLILTASFLVLAPLSGLGLEAIGMHVAAAAIVFSACFALFAFNVMGGGDAKLLSATALWFGLNRSLAFLMTDVAMIGGLVTLLILLVRAQSDSILADDQNRDGIRHRRRQFRRALCRRPSDFAGRQPPAD
ncbi:A24 family peptidase [Rhizobium leguminosarum]|uniref:A24 family peptidase n=1 Tax=Rhizobium leguminosarum TaxID=384 RepID=UPI003D048A02